MLFYIKSWLLRFHDQLNVNFPYRCAHDIYDAGYRNSLLSIKFAIAYPHHPYHINQFDSKKRKEYLIGINVLASRIKMNVARECILEKHNITDETKVKNTLLENGFKLNKNTGLFDRKNNHETLDDEISSYFEAYNEIVEYDKRCNAHDHELIEEQRAKFRLPTRKS